MYTHRLTGAVLINDIVVKRSKVCIQKAINLLVTYTGTSFLLHHPDTNEDNIKLNYHAYIYKIHHFFKFETVKFYQQHKFYQSLTPSLVQKTKQR